MGVQGYLRRVMGTVRSVMLEQDEEWSMLAPRQNLMPLIAELLWLDILAIHLQRSQY
jgi:hypothetical protein